uniref:non-ribosomal peptide synthetase n=1 Tax=Pseudomonas mediterranea TaxID=183795 RepID=UPI0006D8AD5A
MNQSLELAATYPLTASQRDIWLDQMTKGDSPLYTMGGYLHIQGAVDPDRMQQAVELLVRKHDALRTVLHCDVGGDGVPMQTLVESLEVRVPLIDFSNRPEPQTAAQTWVQQGLEVAFELEKGPLFRFYLIKLNDASFYFVVNLHHIIQDGWGINLMLASLSDLYNALEENREPDLSAPSYAGFIEDDARYHDSDRFQRDQAYWLDKYRDVPDPLFTARYRDRYVEPVVPSAHAMTPFPQTLNERIDALALTHQVSRFPVLLATLYVYFVRTTQRDELVVGLPILNRSNPTFKQTVGLFTQVSAMRLRFADDLSFGELIQEVARALKQDYRYQRFPLSDIHRSLELRRDNRAQLFDVSFSYEEENYLYRFGDATAYSVKSSNGQEQMPLAIHFRTNPNEKNAWVHWIYNQAFLQADEIEAMAERFVHVLEQALGDDTLPIRDFVLPTPAEARLLQAWNVSDGQRYEHDRTIHGLFEARAVAQPNAVAVVHEGQTLTYGELNTRANQVAHRLLALGVFPDDRVAICVERGLDMIVGLLGILKSGAGYVPLDPAYPLDRLAFMLEDSSPVALLTQAALQDQVPVPAVPVLLLDQPEAAGFAEQPRHDPNIGTLASHHLAYVIYTSGSTGLPKGVMVEHRNVARLFSATQSWFDFGPQDVWALFHSFAFDFSVWEIWGALTHGGRLLVVPQLVSRSPQDCYALVCEAGVTVLNQTPSAFRQLIAAQGESELKHNLRQVIFGGEALETGILKPWYAREINAGTQLVNMYGITETTVHVTYRALQAADAQLIGVSPIGKRIPDLRLYLLDKYGKPVPKGVEGELYVGGAGVARGYLNRPELNETRFLPDPFDTAANARMYRTGDLGRWLHNGELQYLGRNDEQVKIRGFRIELGEIEARLTACAKVREAVVIAREDEPGNKRLVAYVLAEDGACVSAGELRSELMGSLADYMVPSAFVMLDAFPLTTNGKLDRKALPAPDSQAFARRSYEAPVGQVETTLAALWAELLGVEQVGRHDRFFELGGHSLLAVKLIERMRQLNLNADVGVLFGQPTLETLAAATSTSGGLVVPENRIPRDVERITPDMLPLASLTQGEIDRVVATVPGGADNVQDIYGLVPLQEGILYHHLATSEGDPYLLQALLRFGTRQQLEAFGHALQAVIARHDILRTSVAWEGLGEPVQVVWREARLMVEELALDPADGDIADQLQVRFDPRHTRLDLRQAPMMRIHFAEDTAGGSWVAVLLFHHLIDDATSLGMLGKEIDAHLQGRAAELPVSVPYRNYVAQVRLDSHPEQHEAFFSEMLGDVDEPTLPLGLQDVQGDGSGIEEATLSLEVGLARRLRAQARRLGVSTASLHHLAWGQVVGRLSSRQDVVFGTVLMGRLHSGQEAGHALGMFVNTLPLRVEAGNQGVLAALQATHGRLAALLGHEHAPLSLAQRCSGVAAPAPLFSALMNYRQTAVAAQASEDAGQARIWAGAEILGGEERTNYPLSLSVDDLGDSFGLTVQALAGIGAQRVCGYVHTVLEALADALDRDGDTPLHTLAFVPASERQQLLHDFNDFDAVYPSGLLIHQLFEAHAEAQPEAVALTYQGQSLSYGELNRLSNQIAHRLIEWGIHADDRVAICVERGLEMVAGLVGILKAGAGYVPLDPAYPAERLAYMLEDSAPKVLLTQRSLQERFPAAGVPALLLDSEDRDAAGIDRQPSTNPDAQASGLSPDSLAYVIYTSGSTGQPKGVAMPHRALVNLMQWQIAQARQQGRAVARTLQFAALGFDVAFQEIFSTLCAGGELSLIHADIRLNFHRLFEHIRQQRVERLYLPCIALQALAEAVAGEPEGTPLTCDLKDVITAGEQLRITPQIRALFERLDGCRLHNHYGPTESHVATALTLPDDVAAWPTLPAIGQPVANTRIYLLDAQQQPVPVGVAGEIHIGGICVARGYLNRDDLTAERFVRDPFAADERARLYKTGDLGRYLPNGHIEYLGRNDDQIKIRGFRVELGEIESRLCQHGGVKEAAVVAREDQPGEKRLVAYITAQAPDAAPEADALRAHLQALLPDYMVPAAYVRLEKLPLSPNGKLDRRALPVPEADAFASRAYEAPLGEVETTLAGLWADVLGVGQVGRHDHFFELGGHSLLAVKLIELMRKAGLSADVRVLFGQPTLAALAAAVGSRAELSVPANGIVAGCERITPSMLPLVKLDQDTLDRIVAGVPGGAGNVQDIYPLAPLQEGILYHHIAAEEGDPYLLQATFAMDSRAQLDGFFAALQAVIDRHDILRTALLREGLEAPLQVVLRQCRLMLEEQDLDPARGDIAAQLQGMFDPRRCRMDLDKAPLMRLACAWDSVHQRWVAVLLFHHIALDHTALDVMQEEMLAFLNGEADRLEAAMPYRNYVAQTLLGVPREQHERFFRDMLADVDESTLPFGLREVQGDGRGVEEVKLNVDPDLCRRLRQQARQLGVSAAALHHLAWARVLGRVSGREDVVFGTVLLGRMQSGEGADRALGMFINTLPLRVDVGGQGVRAGVKAIHARLTALLGHEHASLALAQRCSGVPASLPLFSALLNYRHSPLQQGDSVERWAGTQVLEVMERTNYPCMLSVDDQGEGFLLSVQTAGGVDARQVGAYMQTALASLVEALECAPESAINDLEILSENERRQVLQDFNNTAAHFPLEQTVHGLFEEQVQRTPEALAVLHGGQRLSYGELNERANRLAHYLRGQGVRPDSRVAICVERGLDMVVGLLAILKAGGGYVPLDPAYPADRIAYMLEDSAPAVVLAQAATLGLLAGASMPVIDLGSGLWQDESVSNPQVAELTSAHLAYVIYTSGSTGLPKGVMIEHRNTVNFLTWAHRSFDAQTLSKTLFSTSLNFDLAVYECFAPLTSGGSIEVVTNVLELQQGEHDITLINTVPSALKALLESGGLGEGVDTVNVAGEALKRSLVEALFEQTSVKRLCNLYGPSETTTYSSWVSMAREDGFAAHIGKPVANTQFYLLDEHKQPVPLGVPGEIYIGGAGVARGYLNRDDLTAERFLKDPFSSEPNARMYKTGDLGRYLADGNIEYLGRNDDQVKIRGFRIELGEIEARLARHADVKEAVVLAREDVPGDKRLVAYFTPANETADIEALRGHLQTQLPEYMVPVAYVRLDAMPLTPNGKLDRKALPAPDLDSVISRGYEAPQGEAETALAQIWQDLLGLQQVGRHDHFFELGGHSLLAVSLIERMRQAGLSADVRVLFSQPTLAALAAAVGNDAGNEVKVPANLIASDCQRITPDMLPLVRLTQDAIDRIVATVPGGAANVQDIYPLAPLQEGILYHHLAAEQGDPYVLQAQFAFDNRARLDDFTQALQGVIDRHDILRTAMAWEGLDEPVQVVWRQASLGVEQVLLRDEDGDIAVQLNTRQHLDIRQAPLMCIRFAQDASHQRWVATLLFHHMALDHTALEVVRHEMQAHLLGQADQLGAAVPYRNYVAQARLGVSREEHEAFFHDMLGAIDEPTLPFGLQDVRGDGSDVEEARREVAIDLSRRLRSQARRLGVSAASLHHLAWALVLGRVSGREDVVFGTVLMGRMQGGEGADRALGMFINTLPLGVQVGARSVRDGVLATHARLTGLLGHEHASLALAQRCSGVVAPTPLFSALLNYRHSMAEPLALQGSSAWQGIEALGGEERTNYPLALSVDDLGEGFSLTVQAVSGVDAQRVGAYMEAALASLAQALECAPESSLADLSILPEVEREQLLVAFNATDAEYPLDQTIHGLFEEQVQRTSDALAVLHGGQRLSYAELNERANRLAHYLRGQGVRPDSRVAICVERGLDMVVGLLAILKAGGGYVPLDPAYPADRIAYMLEDSAPAVVLAQAATLGLLADATMPVIDLGSGLWQDESVSNPQVPELTSSHLAYVIYTSGSTGLPKGVMIEHRNTVNFLTWAHRSFDAQTLSKTLFSTSLNFDLAVYECFAPLTSGGSIEVVTNVLELQHGEHHITLINTVPSALKALLEAGGLGEGVDTVNVAGEALKRSLVEALFEQTSVKRLCNLYGPSETTTYSSWVSMAREDGFAAHIGKPVANTQFYLLDEHKQPVPLGVPGEIYIGGAGVARGYLNRDDLTAERFLKDPFSRELNARMYKTGDLGRYLPDGNIEYLGRNDDQVKIRGFRIELGEIEAKLAQHDAVKEAVVLAREDVPGDKRLVAYFTESETVDIETLRGHLQAQLPAYMVPVAYVHLDELPLTPNGKLDRKALPAPEHDALITRGYEAPQGEVETTLAQIWQDLLKVERVGRHDHFFELGGHSLLAVSLIERMRQAGLSADVRILFNQSTLAALASAIGESNEVNVPANLIPADCEYITPALLPLVSLSQDAIDRIVATVPGGARNVQDIYPLAPLQEGILYHHLAAEQGDPYVLQAQFAFDSRERLDDFTQALQGVIDRHDILRTAMAWEGLDEPVQVVWRKASLGVEQVSLRDEDGDVAAQLQARFDARHHRLDIRQAPLMCIRFAQDASHQRWVATLLFHHMALDHTALEVVRQEMQAHLLGQAGQLAAAMPYRNYVAQARLGVSQQEHERFFRDMLGGVDEPTLPFGLHDVQGAGQGIEEASLALAGSLSQDLKIQARRLGVSVASLVHLAWAQVLGRVSGRDDVVFGTVLMGRMQGGEGADRALGMFINTLPLRVNLGQMSARAGVKATHGRLTALLGHEHASLALAQRCSGVEAPTPLFSALLNYRHTDANQAPSAWSGIEVLSGEERTNYPLMLSVDDLGEDFSLTVQVVSGIGAQRICAYMEAALASLAQALECTPDSSLADLPILPEAEREQLLVAFNATDAEYPLEQTIHGLFEEQVQRTPEVLAVLHGGQRLSYAELNERANRLAHYLRGQGVRPDSRVAICVERGTDMVVGLLAILKAGGGYVPLDPAYPADRIAYMLEDSAPAVVLAQAATLGLLADATMPVIDLGSGLWQDESVSNPQVAELTSAHLAYVIYTSGSTGLPKGVMIEHRNTVNFLTWAHHAFDAQTLSKTLFSTSLNFDLAVYECFAPLTSGGSIEVVTNVLELQHGEHDITLINTVPSALKALLEAGGLGEGVDTVNVAGEALKRSLVEALFEQTSVKRLCNLYGPSETTTYSSWVSMAREDGFAAHIGKPVANTQFYLLDEHKQPVPLGVPGEIYIGGAGVARGYLNRDDLTAERFLKDPFSATPNARMYKTGDLGRYLPDGNIEYLGRNDDQVKIRGFRIELGEIEAKLARHEAVKEAVVLAREDVPGDKRLVAYFTESETVDIEILRSYLQAQLPAYMVPVAYVHLDALPLTPNGKLDRKALPAPEHDALTTRGYEAPQGEIETTLAQIWQDLLKVERVGRHDHFFELGGHSLLAVSLIERMRQAGLSADVRVLFGQPTLMALAAAVGSGNEIQVPANGIPLDCTRITPEMLTLSRLDQDAIDHIASKVPGGMGNIQDIYPLAPLQEGILYHHLAAEQGDPYVLQSQFAFDSRERLDEFVQALQVVIDRHDILRTAIVWEGLDEPQQVVWREARLGLEAFVADPQAGSVSEQLHNRFNARHFALDLTQAPLMRLTFAEDQADQRWIAMLLFHHIALDHAAMKVVQREMLAYLQGHADQLDTPAPYRNYVAQARLGVSREEHEDFFSDMLGDVDEPTLPFGLHDVQGDGDDIETATQLLDSDLSRRLRRLARQSGVGAASLHHLAWAQVLGRVSGRNDVVFGTVLMGRMQGGEGADRALGMFINTLPLRVSVDEQNVKAGVKEVHGRLTALLGHEHAPLALAQRCSAVAAPTPLFSALLNYRNSSEQANGRDTLAAWQDVETLGGEARTNYPLTLSVDDLGDDFALTVLASHGVGAQRICAYMETALHSLAKALEFNPTTRLHSLEVLPQAERRQVLMGFNATSRRCPRHRTVNDLFEAQVQAHPDAVAVVHGEQRLTYRELNARANRLARHLIGLGTQLGDSVAIGLARSTDLLVSQLAVLKCAAVYVPLDVNAPLERQQFMIQDSGAQLLLTLSTMVVPEGVQRVDLDLVELDESADNLALTQDAE